MRKERAEGEDRDERAAATRTKVLEPQAQANLAAKKARKGRILFPLGRFATRPASLYSENREGVLLLLLHDLHSCLSRVSTQKKKSSLAYPQYPPALSTCRLFHFHFVAAAVVLILFHSIPRTLLSSLRGRDED
ncbi:hypothetical protein BJX65DRAFT_189091 [Aspergillus insuetus]